MAKKEEFKLLEIECSFCKKILSEKERYDCEHEKIIPCCENDKETLKAKLAECEPLWMAMNS